MRLWAVPPPHAAREAAAALARVCVAMLPCAPGLTSKVNIRGLEFSPDGKVLAQGAAKLVRAAHLPPVCCGLLWSVVACWLF